MPLLWISLSFIAGLAAGRALDWSGWLPLSVCLALLTGLLNRFAARMPAAVRRLARVSPFLRLPPLVLLAVLALGAWRMDFAQAVPPDSPAALFNDQGVYRLRGMVVEPPDRREQSTLVRVRLEAAAALDKDGQPGAFQPARGLLLALLPGQAGWRYGDRLELDGRPRTPPGASENDDFSYRDYLTRQGISSYVVYPSVRRHGVSGGSPVLKAIYALREQAYRRLYRIFPAPEAPLLAGILLGIESDMPPSLSRAFQDTGTAHIIAISGFNIAILAALFSTVFTGLLGAVLSRWWVLALTALSIAGYTILAGAGAPVVRAAVMGSLSLLAMQLGRRSAGMAGFNTLAFTAAVMSLFNPYLPWDASFQLSFAATLGLMLYANPLQQGFTRLAALRLPLPLARKIAGPVGEYILFTLAAQLTTLPVILYHFQRLSLSSLLVNPLVLPAQPLVMILSGLAVIAALVFEPLGHLLAWTALPLSAYSIHVIEAFARLPGGVVVLGKLEPATAGLLFAAVTLPAFAAGMLGKIPSWVKAHATPAVVLLAAGLLAALLAREALAAPDGLARVTVFEQGGQPALLAQAPGGSRALINGGSSANRLSADLGRRFSPVGRKVDALVIAECSARALQPLPALVERFTIQSAWWSCAPGDTRAARAVYQALEGAGVESRSIYPGERLLLGGEMILEVLGVQDDTSALRISWQDFHAVLPGGFVPSGLAEAEGTGVLALSAAGLKERSPLAWEALGAQVVVAPPEEPGVILPADWIRLDRWGWATFVTDGRQVWLEQGE